jgi:glutathione S-transferase
MIKLYDFPMSPRVRKARIVLAEKGLEYEKVNIDITKGEQKTAEYLAINPYGKVPALQDQDNGTSATVYESTIIMEYLNDTYPTPPLLPEDSGQRARARVLMHYADNPYESTIATLAGEIIFKPMQGGIPDEAVVSQATADLNACFDKIGQELGNNDYLLESGFSLADIPYVSWSLLFPMLKVDVPSAKVDAWLKKLQERPSVKAAG